MHIVLKELTIIWKSNFTKVTNVQHEIKSTKNILSIQTFGQYTIRVSNNLDLRWGFTYVVPYLDPNCFQKSIKGLQNLLQGFKGLKGIYSTLTTYLEWSGHSSNVNCGQGPLVARRPGWLLPDDRVMGSLSNGNLQGPYACRRNIQIILFLHLNLFSMWKE